MTTMSVMVGHPNPDAVEAFPILQVEEGRLNLLRDGGGASLGHIADLSTDGEKCCICPCEGVYIWVCVEDIPGGVQLRSGSVFRLGAPGQGAGAIKVAHALPNDLLLRPAAAGGPIGGEDVHVRQDNAIMWTPTPGSPAKTAELRMRGMWSGGTTWWLQCGGGEPANNWSGPSPPGHRPSLENGIWVQLASGEGFVLPPRRSVAFFAEDNTGDSSRPSACFWLPIDSHVPHDVEPNQPASGAPSSSAAAWASPSAAAHNAFPPSPCDTPSPGGGSAWPPQPHTTGSGAWPPSPVGWRSQDDDFDFGMPSSGVPNTTLAGSGLQGGGLPGSGLPGGGPPSSGLPGLPDLGPAFTSSAESQRALWASFQNEYGMPDGQSTSVGASALFSGGASSAMSNGPAGAAATPGAGAGDSSSQGPGAAAAGGPGARPQAKAGGRKAAAVAAKAAAANGARSSSSSAPAADGAAKEPEPLSLVCTTVSTVFLRREEDIGVLAEACKAQSGGVVGLDINEARPPDLQLCFLRQDSASNFVIHFCDHTVPGGCAGVTQLPDCVRDIVKNASVTKVVFEKVTKDKVATKLWGLRLQGNVQDMKLAGTKGGLQDRLKQAGLAVGKKLKCGFRDQWGVQCAMKWNHRHLDAWNVLRLHQAFEAGLVPAAPPAPKLPKGAKAAASGAGPETQAARPPPGLPPPGLDLPSPAGANGPATFAAPGPGQEGAQALPVAPAEAAVPSPAVAGVAAGELATLAGELGARGAEASAIAPRPDSGEDGESIGEAGEGADASGAAREVDAAQAAEAAAAAAAAAARREEVARILSGPRLPPASGRRDLVRDEPPQRMDPPPEPTSPQASEAEVVEDVLGPPVTEEVLAERQRRLREAGRPNHNGAGPCPGLRIPKLLQQLKPGKILATDVRVKVWSERALNMHKASVAFPTISPNHVLYNREFEGLPRPRKAQAKRSAEEVALLQLEKALERKDFGFVGLA